MYAEKMDSPLQKHYIFNVCLLLKFNNENFTHQ